MDGRDIILRVRQILRDVQSSTQQGVFWYDPEILLALNAAQDSFVSKCIENKHWPLLGGLIKNLTILSAGTTVPADYLHYVSGMVGPLSQNSVTARIYLGGMGDIYFTVKHDSIIILNDIIYPKSTYVNDGVLYYYRYPTTITNNIYYSDFPEYIYYDIIAEYASIILAMKEVQTQREFKTFKYAQNNLMNIDKNSVNYNNDVEHPVLIEMKGMLNGQRNTQATGT